MKELPNITIDWCEYIGQRICFEKNRNGILRYYGKIKFDDGFWLGIELDEATGENDGSVNGIKYFTCEDQHGIFIPESSSIDISLTEEYNVETVPSNHFEFNTPEVYTDEKISNLFNTVETGFISTEKENLSLNTFPYFSNRLMVPKTLPCILSPLKEESDNLIDISNLNSTTVLSCSYGVDQSDLMKTFKLEDRTFDVENNENIKAIKLADNSKDNSNLTGTDESLGILPALLNDSPSWESLTSDAKGCNKINFYDFADSPSLKNTCNKMEKSNLICMNSCTVAFHNGNVKEGSFSFSDVDSPVLDIENIPVCASTPKHDIFLTNLNKTNTGLHVPKSCSALAVSGDSTLGRNMMQEQVFNFANISTFEDCNITFIQSNSERPLNESHGVSRKGSENELFKYCRSENSKLSPDTIKVIPAGSIIKSAVDPSINILNSTFVHQKTVGSSDSVCENKKQNDIEQNINDITIVNNLNKTFRRNEETINKQKSTSNFSNSSELPKLQLHQNAFIAKQYGCTGESLSSDCQQKKDMKIQTKLSSSKNLSKTIKKTTNQSIQNKNRFSFKYGQTKSLSSEPATKNRFVKTRQSLSAVSDLKRNTDVKNESKYRRSSLSRMENKSSLLNSTITIPKTSTGNLHSMELSKNYSAIPDPLELLNSSGSEKSVITSAFITSCKPNLEQTFIASSEEPVIKPNCENSIDVRHITPTKTFCVDNNSIVFHSENENTNAHCILNSGTSFETHDANASNFAAASVTEPLVTNAVAISEELCPELNVPILICGDGEECIENLFNESTVCTDNIVALENPFKPSSNALNSIPKTDSYKEFANTLKAQNLKADLSTSLCSTSKSENLSKSLVKKPKASTFGFAKTTDKANCMKNKMPRLFGLKSQIETSKVNTTVRQSTGSILSSTSCSNGSNLRITNSKTSSNLRKHSFNQSDVPHFKDGASKSGNCLTKSAEVQKSSTLNSASKSSNSLAKSAQVQKTSTLNSASKSSNSLTMSAQVPKTSTINSASKSSNSLTKSAQVKKTSTLPFKKIAEAGPSNCIAAAKTIKHSQQQNENSVLKKARGVEKTSIKFPAAKLKLGNDSVSKTKPNIINGVCKVNPEKNINSKLAASKNNNRIMPLGNRFGSNIQPPSSSNRFSLSKKEDNNALAPSKGNVQRRSENFGFSISNMPKQRLGIPKLSNRTSTGCEKSAGSTIGKLKSPCQVKKSH